MTSQNNNALPWWQDRQFISMILILLTTIAGAWQAREANRAAELAREQSIEAVKQSTEAARATNETSAKVDMAASNAKMAVQMLKDK